MLLHGWTVYKYCIWPATADTPHKAWLLWGTGQLLSPRPYLVASLVSNQCGSAYDQPLCGVPSRHTYLGLPTEPSHIWEHCVQIIYFSQRKKYLVKTTSFRKIKFFLAAFVYELDSLFQHNSSQKHPTAYHRREVNQRRNLKREGDKGGVILHFMLLLLTRNRESSKEQFSPSQPTKLCWNSNHMVRLIYNNVMLLVCIQLDFFYFRVALYFETVCVTFAKYTSCLSYHFLCQSESKTEHMYIFPKHRHACPSWEATFVDTADTKSDVQCMHNVHISSVKQLLSNCF